MPANQPPSSEPTPVDDVRRVRERLERETGGNIHALADRARAATEKYRDALGLKVVAAPEKPTRPADAVA